MPPSYRVLYIFSSDESIKDGKSNKLSIGELANIFDPNTGSEISLQSNQHSYEESVHPSGYELPINDANQQSVSHTSSPTKTPPMTMAVSNDDPSITKYTIPITHVEGSNHRSFGATLQLNGQTGQVIITKVGKGSLADQFCIKVRDELISVNNFVDLNGSDLSIKFASCISDLFKHTDPQELTLQLKRPSSP